MRRQAVLPEAGIDDDVVRGVFNAGRTTAYYFDHQADIDRKIQEEEAFVGELRKTYAFGSGPEA